jgi:hypothetical protein
VRFVNRAVLVLRARQPYVDWANACAAGEGRPAGAPEGRAGERVSLDDARSAGSAFLIPPIDRDEDARDFVERHADTMFEHELFMWNDDPSFWPERRDAETFREWFDIEVHEIVIDLGDGPVLAEELE